MENVMIDEEVWIVKKIGVEQSLTNIQAALREKGYEVVSLQKPFSKEGFLIFYKVSPKKLAIVVKESIVPILSFKKPNSF